MAWPQAVASCSCFPAAHPLPGPLPGRPSSLSTSCSQGGLLPVHRNRQLGAAILRQRHHQAGHTHRQPACAGAPIQQHQSAAAALTACRQVRGSCWGLAPIALLTHRVWHTGTTMQTLFPLAVLHAAGLTAALQCCVARVLQLPCDGLSDAGADRGHRHDRGLRHLLCALHADGRCGLCGGSQLPAGRRQLVLYHALEPRGDAGPLRRGGAPADC